MSAVSTSGIEISAALAVAAVAVTCRSRPDVLLRAGTQVHLAVCGSVLVLSRQTGVLTLLLLLGVAAVFTGPARLWRLVRPPRPVTLGCVAVLVGSGLALLWWERRYDRPVLTGSPWSLEALQLWPSRLPRLLQDAIGNLGWLDTPLPFWGLALWVVTAVVLIGLALLAARPRDAVVLILGLLTTVAVAYVLYAVVFFPIASGIQGRHVLPMFVLVPLLAGAVVAGSPALLAVPVVRRLALWAGASAAVLQVLAVYVNARRYAVGGDGPLLFLDDAQWQPPGGWVPWLLLAAAAGVGLVLVASRLVPRAARH